MMLLVISAKCNDLCNVDVIDKHDKTVYSEYGYAPYIDCIGGGDYVELEIDTETGMIMNWNQEDFSVWLESTKEDEEVMTEEEKEEERIFKNLESKYDKDPTWDPENEVWIY